MTVYVALRKDVRIAIERSRPAAKGNAVEYKIDGEVSGEINRCAAKKSAVSTKHMTSKGKLISCPF